MFNLWPAWFVGHSEAMFELHGLIRSCLTGIYCAAYGSGNFIVRGFGPDAFQLNGHREASDAVHQAPGVGQPVTQEIAM